MSIFSSPNIFSSFSGFSTLKVAVCFVCIFLFTSNGFSQENQGINTANEPTSPSLEIVDISWILAFEQAYGVYGLYTMEPEKAEDKSSAIRRDLIHLTKLAWEYLEENPEGTPSISNLYVDGLLESFPDLPDGVEYVYSKEQGRYVSNLGEEYDIINGAIQQLRESEKYRRTVIRGSFTTTNNLNQLAQEENVPEMIAREIETRLFVSEFLAHPQIELLREVQDRLGELHLAILKGKASGLWFDGDQLTMEQIGQSGLIEFLEALPNGGQYSLSPVPEPPSADFGVRKIELNPNNLRDLIYRNVTAYLENIKPDYPPAMLIQASNDLPASGFATMNKAIELWPDAPALRVQRAAMSFQIKNGDHLINDLSYLLQRFPAAPILLELISASSDSDDSTVQDWHQIITDEARTIRPEVLPVQITALKVASDSGDEEKANAIFNYLINQHPGYRPLLSKWITASEPSE